MGDDVPKETPSGEHSPPVEPKVRLCYVQDCSARRFDMYKFCKLHKTLHDELIAKAKNCETPTDSILALRAVRAKMNDPRDCSRLCNTYMEQRTPSPDTPVPLKTMQKACPSVLSRFLQSRGAIDM